MQIARHEMIRAKAAALMAGRAGWSGPLGMTMTAGQQEQEGGSLLDEAAENGGGGDTGGGENGSGGDAGGEGGDNGGSEDWDAREARLRREFESEMDRRITSAVNTVTRRLSGQQQNGGQHGAGGGDDGGQQQGGGNGGGSGQQRGTTGPAAGDVREARLAYREYVTDGFRFLGDVEREHAMGMAQGMLPALLSGGMDPDEAGREAAKQVRSSVQALRKHYEGQTISALKRKGLLPEDARVGQPPVAGTSTKRAPGAESGYAAGAAKAGALFPDRVPAKQD